MFALGACSGGSSNGETQQGSADSVPDTAVPTADGNLRRHNADNFFAISSPAEGIFVGNNVEMLSRIDIDSSTAVVLAPDGNTIAYADSDTTARRIHLYKIDSGDDRVLDFGPFDCRPDAFDAEGRILAFTLSNLYDVSKVYIFDAANRTKMMISREGDADGDYNPTFSPDGAYLLFHNMQKVKLYTMNNGYPKFWKNIDCENFCQRNDLVLTPECKFQMSGDHRYIVFSCLDYSLDHKDSYRLIVYDVESSEIRDILPDDLSCADFQVSDDGSIYYIQVSADSTNYLYMADIVSGKPVRVSPKRLSDSLSLSIAY